MTGSRLGTRQRRRGSRVTPPIASVPGGILPWNKFKNGTGSYPNWSVKKSRRELSRRLPSLFLSELSGKSIEPWLDDRCKRIPRAIQPRLHRAEITVRDLRDLFVRLSFQLAQHEHLAMMLR